MPAMLDHKKGRNLLRSRSEIVLRDIVVFLMILFFLVFFVIPVFVALVGSFHQWNPLKRQFGFKGKLLIHPLQVATVNEVFSPAESDVTYARKIVESFDEARAQGLGAISLDGKMVDVANYRQAQDLLASAEAIARRREG